MVSGYVAVAIHLIRSIDDLATDTATQRIIESSKLENNHVDSVDPGYWFLYQSIRTWFYLLSISFKSLLMQDSNIDVKNQ